MLIRYYGHVGVPSGYGDAAAETCMAILGTGVELEISTDGDRCSGRFLPLARCFRSEADLAPPDVVIVHTLPLNCADVIQKAQIRERFPRALCVAYTTWEGASPITTSMERALHAFDHVWVPSQATAWAMQVGGLAHVRVVPHAFEEARWGAVGPRVAPVHPYRFYYVGAWSGRKNVDGVIRAYLRAFDRSHDVELVIQSAQAPISASQIARLSTGLDTTETPTVRFSSTRITEAEIQLLHASCHCFVTASRGEAWNLPAFDAMIARAHIIAPRGLGSDDFLDWTSAELYRTRRVPAGGDVRLVGTADAPPGHAVAQFVGSQGLTVRSDWHEPDLCELSIKMRAAFLQRTMHLRVDYDPVERFGRAAVGRRIVEIIQGATS